MQESKTTDLDNNYYLMTVKSFGILHRQTNGYFISIQEVTFTALCCKKIEKAGFFPGANYT